MCYILIAEQLPGVHWWYKTASHPAELTSGFYNSSNRDGYAAVAAMLKKRGAVMNLTLTELHFFSQQEDLQEARADPQALVWQVNLLKLQFTVSK